MTTFEVTLVARTPQSSGSPTLVEIDRIVVDTIAYIEELNRPGTATLGCSVQALSTAVKNRLVDLVANPSEVRIYAGSTIAWAGEIQTLQIQDQALTLNCVGLLGYTFRMGVIADLSYSGIDQFTIAKGLVDQWQAQTYANYGIDTSTVGTSGIVRDRTYLRNELHNVGQRLSELGAVLDGFDIKVDPTTRKLVLAYPQSGTDLSASVFFDERNIDSSNIAVSVAPGDLDSDVSATGTSTTSDGANNILYSARSTSSVQTSFGRTWDSLTFDGVSVQATLDGHADAYLQARNQQLIQPGVSIVTRIGADVGDFHTGDTVSYSYDAGLGVQAGTLRIVKLEVDVDGTGKQRIQLEYS
jgi:hypothetical protein